MFTVEFGADRNGRARRRHFATLDAARAFCNDYFRRRGVVLGIEQRK